MTMSKALLVALLTGALLFLAAGCGGPAEPAQPATPQTETPGDSEEVTSVACISKSVVATSFEELEREATAIVIGTGTGESRPMDELEPGTNFGVAYQVEVERYLKGTGPDMLPVYNMEGCTSTVRGKPMRGPWVNPPPPIREGARYLFFLRPHPYLPDPDVMWRVTQPSRFLLDGGTASPDVSWPGPMKNFPAMPESDLVGTVEAIVRQATIDSSS